MSLNPKIKADKTTQTIPARKSLLLFEINGNKLEFWLEGIADIWVCKQNEYFVNRWKICGIVNGEFVRYPGLPVDIGLRLNVHKQILEVNR